MEFGPGTPLERIASKNYKFWSRENVFGPIFGQKTRFSIQIYLQVQAGTVQNISKNLVFRPKMSKQSLELLTVGRFPSSGFSRVLPPSTPPPTL